MSVSNNRPQEGEGAQGWPKFSAPPTMFDSETQSKKMTPSQGFLNYKELTRINTMLSQPQITQAESIALHQRKHEILSGLEQNAEIQSYLQDFFQYCIGKSKYNVTHANYNSDILEHGDRANGGKGPTSRAGFLYSMYGQKKVDKQGREVTPWGSKPMTHLPDVRDFVASFVDKRMQAVKIITTLKLRYPQNIDELWIYYKYIARGEALDNNIIEVFNFLNPYDWLTYESYKKGTPVDGKRVYQYTEENPDGSLNEDGTPNRVVIGQSGPLKFASMQNPAPPFGYATEDFAKWIKGPVQPAPGPKPGGGQPAPGPIIVNNPAGRGGPKPNPKPKPNPEPNLPDSDEDSDGFAKRVPLPQPGGGGGRGRGSPIGKKGQFDLFLPDLLSEEEEEEIKRETSEEEEEEEYFSVPESETEIESEEELQYKLQTLFDKLNKKVAKAGGVENLSDADKAEWYKIQFQRLLERKQQILVFESLFRKRERERRKKENSQKNK